MQDQLAIGSPAGLRFFAGPESVPVSPPQMRPRACVRAAAVRSGDTGCSGARRGAETKADLPHFRLGRRKRPRAPRLVCLRLAGQFEQLLLTVAAEDLGISRGGDGDTEFGGADSWPCSSVGDARPAGPRRSYSLQPCCHVVSGHGPIGLDRRR